MKKLLFLGAVLLLLASCSSSRAFYNKPQTDIHYGIAQDEHAIVEMAFIGALGRNFIFECDVKNISDREISVDQQDFFLVVGGDREIASLNPKVEIGALDKEQTKLKKQKKANTFLAILGAGVTVLAGAAAGAPAGETIAFAAEPLIYMADDADWANRNIKSIDEEIAYLDSALFSDQSIIPNASITKDVLFDAQRIQNDVTLILVIEDREYAVDFNRSLFDL